MVAYRQLVLAGKDVYDYVMIMYWKRNASVDEATKRVWCAKHYERETFDEKKGCERETRYFSIFETESEAHSWYTKNGSRTGHPLSGLTFGLNGKDLHGELVGATLSERRPEGVYGGVSHSLDGSAAPRWIYQ